jgi:simple sugar transport system ATP-binding protein/ribose transport system ATP-binding protein
VEGREVTSSPPHVELRGVRKRFGGVQALQDVSLSIARGSIHALVGENGAGKSTLGKIIAGVHVPDEGALVVDGRVARYASPRDALADGITTVAQELTLVPQRTVIENVFLGSETNSMGFVRRRAMRARFAALCEEAGFDLPPHALVRDLRVADQQKVEILRALARDARLIVVDEPTAALTADESERLLAILRSLRARGTTLVYVSHFLKEVLSIADHVTVLRDGRVITTAPASSQTPQSLVTAMLGRTMEMTFPAKVFPADDAPIVLAVRDLTRRGVIEGISFELREGEIVGLAGLIGSGRTEIARAIFGADRCERGEIELRGRKVRIGSPGDAVRAGIALLPESRKQGLLMRSPILHNVSLAHLSDVTRVGFLDMRAERRRVQSLAERVDLRAPRPSTWVANLSGGNQQKTLFAKWLFRRPVVLIADEPTRGVDVGAKRAIYDLICSLAAKRMAVLLISSEIEEIIGLAHRILVIRGGRLVSELDGRSATEDDILHAAFATRGAAA